MAIEKYILSVEFRYHVKPTSELDSWYNDKKFVIGKFDDFDSAANKGNELVGQLVNRNCIKTKDRFSRGGFIPNTIVVFDIINKRNNKRACEVFITIKKSVEITMDEAFDKFDKFNNGNVLHRNDIWDMALTKAEIEYMSKMPARLKGIEEQVKRVADLLEKIVIVTEDFWMWIKLNKIWNNKKKNYY